MISRTLFSKEFGEERKILIIEVFSKPWVRLEGESPSDEKTQSATQVDEHFEEACNTAIGP